MPSTEIVEEPLVETDIEAIEPTRYKVILHNDDKTTMDFVVMLLQSVFYKTYEESVELTMNIHHYGFGVAGVYTQEVAEEKSIEANELASSYGFPLKTTFEEE